MSTTEPTITQYDGESGVNLLKVIQPIYAEVYAEPPYCEGPAEVDDFRANWSRFGTAPGFRLVLAHVSEEPVGFAFGVPLSVDTGWWNGLLDHVPASVTREHEGRTFAVIELAVRSPYRRRGIARSLHEGLLAKRPGERATLLVRPEAEPASAAYKAWGYQPLGRIRPYASAPVYIAMIRDLPLWSNDPS